MRTTLALLFLTAAASGCGSNGLQGKSCTEIGCVDGLSVDLSQPFKTQGSYTVTVQTDKGTTTCQTKLPFDGCSGAPACPSSDVLLELSGCALPADQHEIVGMRVSGFPSSVTIKVTRDGSEVLSSTQQVTYTTSRPNGPDCEPVCKQAHTTLTVDKPLPPGTPAR